MNAEALRGHLLVLLATAVGILGMGLVFDAVMTAKLAEAVQGTPLLFLGLWWAGRDLGRSMLAARARKLRGEPGPVSGEGEKGT
jgi:hypothetical protein